jgi:PhnB protein
LRSGYHSSPSLGTSDTSAFAGAPEIEEIAMAVKPIPQGFHPVTPYLIVRDGARALDFYKRAFGAAERMRMPQPDGKIGHAEITIGDSIIMLSDENPDMGFRGPQSLGGSSVMLLIYVTDVDARFSQAIAAGAKEVRPVVDQFYGDRSGTLADPFGHVWTIATHVEDVSDEECARRFQEMMAGAGACAG